MCSTSLRRLIERHTESNTAAPMSQLIDALLAPLPVFLQHLRNRYLDTSIFVLLFWVHIWLDLWEAKEISLREINAISPQSPKKRNSATEVLFMQKKKIIIFHSHVTCT